jgi:hypothetical protein
VHHARLLEQRLIELGRNDISYRIYIYEGKGHGHDDDRIVCESIERFLTD